MSSSDSEPSSGAPSVAPASSAHASSSPERSVVSSRAALSERDRVRAAQQLGEREEARARRAAEAVAAQAARAAVDVELDELLGAIAGGSDAESDTTGVFTDAEEPEPPALLAPGAASAPLGIPSAALAALRWPRRRRKPRRASTPRTRRRRRGLRVRHLSRHRRTLRPRCSLRSCARGLLARAPRWARCRPWALPARARRWALRRWARRRRALLGRLRPQGPPASTSSPRARTPRTCSPQRLSQLL